MIDSGVPPGEEWPDGVLDALRQWEQGDIVANPPFFYFADPARPVWEATRLYMATSSGPEIVLPRENSNPPYGLITTQTCDIGEEESRRPVRPWVQISPVYEMTDKGWKKKVRRGGGPRYWLLVPGLPEEQVWVADLRIEVPVEKGWLAGQQRIDGFRDEELKAVVGARLAWLRGRPAFSTDFNALVYNDLFEALETLSEADSDLHEKLMDQLEEVAVLVDSHLQPTSVQLVFLTPDGLDPECREWLEQWRDSRLDSTLERGITLHALDFRELDAVTATEYRRMTIIWRRPL